MKAKLTGVIIFNIIIIIFELLFAFIANANSLYADAFHNASDVLALIVSYVALLYKGKQANYTLTYGYIRAEMLAAFVNSCFLIVTTIYVMFQVVFSWIQGYETKPVIIIIVACVAFVGNVFSSVLLFQKQGNSSEHTHCGHSHADMNIHSAFLHMLGDSLVSFVVILGGVAIYFFHIYWIDSIAALGISFYIFYITYPLLKYSFQSLMDMNIQDSKPIIESILSFDEVVSLHHFHMSQPSSKDCFVTVHLVLKDEYAKKATVFEVEELLGKIRTKLLQHKVNHIVLQPETAKFESKEVINCPC